MKVPNIANLSVFLAAVSKTPDVYVESTYAVFNDSQKTELRSSAYTKAIKKATARASAIAKAAGYNNITIVKVIMTNSHILLTTIPGILHNTQTHLYYAYLGNLTVSVNVVFKYN